MKLIIETTDNRLKLIAEDFKKRGYSVKEFEDTDTTTSIAGDVFIFPPTKKFTASELSAFSAGVKIFTGKLSTEAKGICTQKGIDCIDYFDYELFSIKNAILTSEGVLAKILELSPKSIYQNNILILGYGRCGKALSGLLAKLGATFAVCDFNEQFCQQAYYSTQRVFYGKAFLGSVNEFDVIVNTIPCQILTDDDVRRISIETLYLEIASVQSISSSATQNINYIKLPALPSKFCPKTASDLIGEIITAHLEK